MWPKPFAANAGKQFQFRLRGPRRWPGVAELGSLNVMRTPWKLAAIAVAFLALLLVVVLLIGPTRQPKVAKPSLAVLGVATNHL